MAAFLDTPVDISPTAGSWQTVDLDTYIADLPSDISGVMLKFVTTGSIAIGARKTGSSDNRTQSNYYSGASLYSGCDASHQVDIYRGTTGVTVYVTGYFTTDATFFTNAYDKSPSTTSAWTDIDCSSEIPSGAVAAIFDVKSSGTSGIRNNGSTDNRTSGTTARFGCIVGIDANRICEFYTTVASGTLYLVGYLTLGTFKTNGVDVSIGSTGSYIDVDRSGDSDSNGAVGVVVEIKSSLDRYYGLRKNDTAGDIYLKHQYKEWGVAGLDANKIFEGKIDNLAVDFFVIGYLKVPSGSTTYYQTNTGSFPAPVASLANAVTFMQTASGNMPYATGTVIKQINKNLVGDAPYSTGSLIKQINKNLSGDSPAPIGSLGTVFIAKQALTGVLGAITGALSIILNPVAPTLKKLVKLLGASFKRFIGG